jgi:flagellar basal body-associated protein FliL
MQSTISAFTSKKKRLLFILIPLVVMVVGFSLGGVIYTSFKGEGSDVQLNKPDIQSIAKVYPKEDNKAIQTDTMGSESVTVPAPEKESTAQQAETDKDTAQVSTYNPFEFSYDRKHAEEKLKLMKELELEEIKARIREAQQKGKKEAQGISSRMTLPPLDTLPKIQTSQKDLQSAVIDTPKKEVALTKKVRIPGYNGVIISGQKKAVVLDDGNVYEPGSQVLEGIYVDKILSSSDVFLKDIFGNVFKLKLSAYEVTLYIPR